MVPWLFWLMLAFAIADWISSWRNWRNIRRVTKPGTLLLLIAWFTQIGGWRGPLVWFGLGLVFSLLGDILLQEPTRLFLFGMAAFFAAHGAYIVGLVQSPFSLDWKMIFPLLGIIVIYVLFIRRIHTGLRAHGETGMLPPVLGYSIIISLMLLCAISTLFRPGWEMTSAILVSLGAGLFYVSDSTLAYNRFVCPVLAGDVVVMVTYHLAQILIAGGALLQFA